MSAPLSTRGRLVAVDYPGRRAESRIADLCLEQEGWPITYLLAPPYGRELTSRQYAAGLVTRLPLEPTEVVAVLAYCMAAPIAQDVAALLSRPEHAVPLVLFDGEPCTPEAVAAEVATVLRQVGGGRRDSALTLPSMSDEQLRSAPHECIRQWREAVVSLGTQTLVEDGLPEPEARLEAEDIAEFYLDWLAYVVSAHNTAWPRWDGSVFHLVSRTHHYTRDWPGARATHVTWTDSGRNELLARCQTRELAHSLLQGGLVPARD